jgi:hypothetical protein
MNEDDDAVTFTKRGAGCNDRLIGVWIACQSRHCPSIADV